MREWTTVEIRLLRDYAGLGRDSVATLLDRHPKAVETMAWRHGISLQRSDYDIDLKVTDIVESLLVHPALSEALAEAAE